MPLLSVPYLGTVLSTAAVYLFLLLFIRLFGRKEMSQLSVVDLIFVLLISNAVQNAMVGPDSSLLGGLVSAASLFLVNYLLKITAYRFPWFNTAMEGEAVTLIYKGQINIQNAAKVRMSAAEIEEAVREHGVKSIQEVDLAVLEVDGNISVLSQDFQARSQHKRKTRKTVKQVIE